MGGYAKIARGKIAIESLQKRDRFFGASSLTTRVYASTSKNLAKTKNFEYYTEVDLKDGLFFVATPSTASVVTFRQFDEMINISR
mmetsp:Transcript_32970/g.49144  ORF Transcript_32970/g.49144 Transcript_32970/m.49144 type:complete len:85 (+) Transcript_32970:1658-1912(+)